MEKEQLRNLMFFPPWVSDRQVFRKLDSDGRSESVLGRYRFAVAENMSIREVTVP